MQTVTNPVIQEVMNNTGLPWVGAVAWCDANLLPGWRAAKPMSAAAIEIDESGEYEE